MSNIVICLNAAWKSSRIYTVIRIIGKILVPLFSLLSTFLLKEILESLTGVEGSQYFYELVVILFILSLIQIFINKTISGIEILHNDLLKQLISSDIMNKALDSDIELFDNPNYYDQLTIALQNSDSFNRSFWSTVDCLSAAFTFLVSFVVLTSTNILYGILLTVASIPSAFFSVKYTRELYNVDIEQIKSNREKEYYYRLSTLKEYSQVIRLYDLGKNLSQKYQRIWKAIYSTRKRKISKRYLIDAFLNILPEIVVIYITFEVGNKVILKQLSIGDYSLYTGLTTQLFSGITLLITSITTIYDNQLRVQNVQKFQRLKSHIINGTLKIQKIEKIVFRDVVFIYPGSDKIAINHLNLIINSGEKIGIVGINGSGKSTLIKLLLRFYDVTNGIILINDIPINEIEISSLRRLIAAYFQNDYNFAFTLRENIAISNVADINNDEKIISSLNSSSGSNILRKAHKNLDTYLGRIFDSNGIELSGGEHQKVALARTLFKSADVLILDEPTSSLDPEAEHIFFEYIKSYYKNRTILITSHRLSNLNFVDRIIVMEQGEIVETGSKEELLNADSKFSKFYNYQRN